MGPALTSSTMSAGESTFPPQHFRVVEATAPGDELVVARQTAAVLQGRAHDRTWRLRPADA